jgi:hypothetical protein
MVITIIIAIILVPTIPMLHLVIKKPTTVIPKIQLKEQLQETPILPLYIFHQILTMIII